MRRCAQRASCATVGSHFLRHRILSPMTVTEKASSSKVLLPLSRYGLAFRNTYSTTADAAAEAVSENSTSEEKIYFKDLQDLGVNEALISTITQGMKYETMTPVQAKTIPPALKGTDIVAQAKTGTGKTLAFLVPLLQRMIAEDPSLAKRGAAREARADDIRGIVLSPTRELAEQIAEEARRLTRNTGLVIQTAVGGTNRTDMLRKAHRQGCHLLVGTPGRINDLLRDPSSGIEAPQLASLTLDEADRMLDIGFERELNEILDMLPRPDDKIRQTMLVSATIPDSVIRLARNMVRANDFQFVQTIPENESLTHEHVPQFMVPVSSWVNIYPALFELIEKEAEKASSGGGKPFKAIVYLNTTAGVELVTEIGYHLRTQKTIRIPQFHIQSLLSQNQRSRAAELFRKAESAILYSSDVTARGMDFPNVTHVIQVDLPRDRETYIHRLGRTGRQQKDGQGWILLPPGQISQAKRLLRGLSLKQNTSLVSAEAPVDAAEPTPWHQEILNVGPKLDRAPVAKSYQVTLNTATSNIPKDELVEDLNDMVVRGLGWPEPPMVTAAWASKRGLPRGLLNIGREEPDYGHGRGSNGNGRFGNDRFSRNGSYQQDRGRSRQDRESRDPFARMGSSRRKM